MSIKLTFFIIAIISLGFMSFTAINMIKDPWKVPTEYKTKKNPVQSSKQSIGYGKELYEMSCSSCHGAKGYGDGVKAKNLNIELFDLSKADFQNKFTDGEIYYQSFIGRYRWHDFRGAIQDDEDRWHVVNYIRSLKK